MASLAEVKEALQDTLNRDDATEDQLLRWINLGLTRIARFVRLPFMEAFVDVAVDANGKALVPTNMLENIAIYHSGCPGVTLQYTSLSRLMAQRSACGPVRYYTRVGGQYAIAPSNAGGTLSIHYFRDLPLLVTDEDVDPILIVAQDVVVLAALIEAFTVFVDDRLAQFEGVFQSRI